MPQAPVAPASSFVDRVEGFVRRHLPDHGAAASPALLELEEVAQKVLDGERLGSDQLIALAGPVSRLQPGELRRLADAVEPGHRIWGAFTVETLFETLASRAGLHRLDGVIAAAEVARLSRPVQPELAEVEAVLRGVVEHGEALTAEQLQGLAQPLARLEPAALRQLNRILAPELPPFAAANAQTLLGALAERCALGPEVKRAAVERYDRLSTAAPRIAGPVQETLDRVLNEESLTPDEFSQWLDGLVKLSAIDRRSVATQLFGDLGLKPAMQDEIAREVARRVGVPEALADAVPHYRAGQDLALVAYLSYRLCVPFVNVGAEVGAGAVQLERDLATDTQVRSAMVRQAAQLYVGSGEAVQYLEGGKVKGRYGLGIAAVSNDPVFGPVIGVGFGPYASLSVGKGNLFVGARLTHFTLLAPSYVQLGVGFAEPRLERVTRPIDRAIQAIGQEMTELNDFVARKLDALHGPGPLRLKLNEP